MPQLTWVGKDKVKNHHHEVPFHLLDKIRDFQAAPNKPDNRRDNILIHGDNLLALKSLLPEFGGRVNCIYIDPPYNTGNEGWVYNDNVNDPRIQKWLGAVVGKEGEDLSRHDKWLCMMYPRLKLLKQLLADDGVIFISIDDNEQAALKLVCDEVFGYLNHVGTLIWDLPRGINAGHIARSHEYIFVFSRNKKLLALFNRLSSQDKQSIERCNKKVDKRHPASILNIKAGLRYEGKDQVLTGKIEGNEWIEIIGKLEFKDGRLAKNVSLKAGWTMKDMFQDWQNGKVVSDLKGQKIEEFFFRENGRLYSKKVLETQSVKSILKELPDTHIGNSEIIELFSKEIFPYAKPSGLIEYILEIATNKKSIILDSFVGSGTTAHAVLNLNRKDGGNRRFIGIEMMDYAENITAERIRRVINGYGTKPETQQGTGGGFAFYRVGDALFDAEQNLNPAAPVESVRRYIAYTEGLPASALPEHERPPENGESQHKNPVSPYFLGMKDGAAYLFHYEPDRATDLSLDFLQTIRTETLPEKPERWVIYADRTLLSQEQMKQLGIIFKRIPRDISKL